MPIYKRENGMKPRLGGYIIRRFPSIRIFNLRDGKEFLSHCPFDQLISEKENENGVLNWMHVGYKHPDGRQRRQFLSMINGRYLPMTD